MSDNPLMIPGANFTSDTRNYPWHQPPEFTDISLALDKIAEKLVNKKTARKLVATAEVGIPLYRIAMLIVMEGVSIGKWTVDMALLLAGPVTKMIEILCVQYDVEYSLGLEEEEEFVTGFYVKSVAGGGKETKLEKAMPEIKAQAESFEEQEAPESPLEEGGMEEPETEEEPEGFAMPPAKEEEEI